MGAARITPWSPRFFRFQPSPCLKEIASHVIASRYSVLPLRRPVCGFGHLVASLALLIYEVGVVMVAVFNVVREASLSPVTAKSLAVGLIGAVDVFLIAIAVYITSLGIYTLFVDEGLSLPHWLTFHDLDDLKGNLVSVVIAVLAVLFLREAVAWDGTRDLLGFGISLAVMIAALTFFLTKKGRWSD